MNEMADEQPAQPAKKKIAPKLAVKKAAKKDDRSASKVSKSSFVWLDGIEGVVPPKRD